MGLGFVKHFTVKSHFICHHEAKAKFSFKVVINLGRHILTERETEINTAIFIVRYLLVRNLILQTLIKTCQYNFVKHLKVMQHYVKTHFPSITCMRSVRFLHSGWWKLQMYVLLLSAVNLVFVDAVYAHPVVVLELTSTRIAG
jgi:hypothetical protein